MTKGDFVRRLRRIEGQMRGLQRMVQQDRRPVEVLMQIASAREALRRAAAQLLKDHLASRARGVMAGDDPAGEERAIAELVTVFGRWVR